MMLAFAEPAGVFLGLQLFAGPLNEARLLSARQVLATAVCGVTMTPSLALVFGVGNWLFRVGKAGSSSLRR